MKTPFFIYYTMGVLTMVAGLLLYSGVKTMFQPTLKDVLSAQTQAFTELKSIKQEVIKLQIKDETYQKSLRDVQKVIETLRAKTDGLSSKTASSSPTPTPLSGYITIKSSTTKQVDVYQIRSISSKSIGRAIYGKTYEFIDKQDGYYLVVLSETAIGWMKAELIKEVTTK